MGAECTVKNMYYFTFHVNFCVTDPGSHLCGNRQLMSSIAGMQMVKQNKKWSFSAPVEGLHCYSAPL